MCVCGLQCFCWTQGQGQTSVYTWRMLSISITIHLYGSCLAGTCVTWMLPLLLWDNRLRHKTLHYCTLLICWFAAQEIFLIIINVKNSCAAQFFFVESVRHRKKRKFMLLFSKDSLNGSKVSVKTFIMLPNISISNKCCSFELSIHLWILKNKMHYGFHKNIGQHNCFQHW